MACVGTRANKWEYCGVWTRCVIGAPHGGLCEYQTPTQAVEEAVRVVLGDESADIGVRWGIVGLLYNGHPLGKSEWAQCSDVGLPVIGWDGPPRESWEIDVGRAFRCNVCRKVAPESFGAYDDMPDACYDCWNKAHASDKCSADRWLAEKGVYVRCVASVGHTEHLYEPAYQAVQRAVAEDLAIDPSTVSAYWIEATGNWGVLVDGAPVSATRLLSIRRTLPISGMWPLPPPRTGLPDDGQHGRTLAAHFGMSAWDEMTDESKAYWAERARRLRKRWGIGEMVIAVVASAQRDHLVAEQDRLLDEIRVEPEAEDTDIAVDAAIAVIKRLRRERDEARETLHAERMVAMTVLNAARNAVSQWSKWGSIVANSAMHDLRVVMEKVK